MSFEAGARVQLSDRGRGCWLLFGWELPAVGVVTPTLNKVTPGCSNIVWVEGPADTPEQVNNVFLERVK